MPKGGPDGGDGGRGGDVVLVCDAGRRRPGLAGRSKHFRAGRGAHGQGSRKHGERGEDRVVAVPPGTAVTGLDGSTAELLADGQRVVVARGGGGGHGNKRFATSTRQSPRFAERGLQGESGWIELRLKLLADVGLVGLPNAGKSSLLARLTRAAPKVADYPFTTLEPVLGTIELDDRQIVLADIPGLIEGAAEGAGLGHEFLAHVERCRLLVHLVEVEPAEGDPERNYETVRSELGSYGARPEPAARGRRPLQVRPGARGARGRAGRGLEGAAWAMRSPAVLAISSATGAGLDELRREVVGAAARGARARGRAAATDSTPSTGSTAPARTRASRSSPDGDGRWRVTGRGIELLVARHDLANPEALDYLEGRLREIGVIAELQRAGFERGDEVVVGEVEFELDPS